MKLKCYTLQHQLSDYIDDTLSARRKALVAVHLRVCPMCQNEVAALKKTRELVGNFYVAPAAPDAYYARFAAQLQKQMEGTPSTSLHQRIRAAVTRFGWQLQTQVFRCLPQGYLRGYPFLTSRALPVYVLLIAMTALGVATLVLRPDVPLAPGTKQQLWSERGTLEQPPAVAQLPVAEKRALSVGMHASQDVVASAGTDELMPLGSRQLAPAPVTVRQTASGTNGSDSLRTGSPHPVGVVRFQTAPTGTAWRVGTDAVLASESASLPTRGMLLTDTAYGLLLVQGIAGTDEGWKPYQPKRRGNLTGFARKLLDVPLETRTIREVYDSIKL